MTFCEVLEIVGLLLLAEITPVLTLWDGLLVLSLLLFVLIFKLFISIIIPPFNFDYITKLYAR